MKKYLIIIIIILTLNFTVHANEYNLQYLVVLMLDSFQQKQGKRLN